MDKLELFKKERSGLMFHRAMPIDATRAKFEFTDREIKGYPIVWNSKNDYGEIAIKGAASRSLQERGVGSSAGNKITILLQHDSRKPLCIPAELYEDDYGLYFRAEIDEGVSYCDDTVASVRQKTISQLSYGFNYVWEDNKTIYDAERDAFLLYDIELYEISLVTFSSDPNARLRSYRENQLRDMLADVRGLDVLDDILALQRQPEPEIRNDKDILNNYFKLF